MDYEMMVKCAYEEIVGEIEKEAADWSAPTGNGFSHLNNAQRNLISSYSNGKNIFNRDSMAKKLDAGISKMQNIMKQKLSTAETSGYKQNIQNIYNKKIQNIQNMKANILGTKPSSWAFGE